MEEHYEQFLKEITSPILHPYLRQVNDREDKHRLETYEMVYEHFKGDSLKTNLWFKTPNPALGKDCPEPVEFWKKYRSYSLFVKMGH